MTDPILVAATGGPRALPPGKPDATLEAARAFEAAFLSEMLKHAGLGESRDSFGGGAGETQFAGFLRDAQARQMADSGGIGLAQYIVTALKGAADGP